MRTDQEKREFEAGYEAGVRDARAQFARAGQFTAPDTKYTIVPTERIDQAERDAARYRGMRDNGMFRRLGAGWDAPADEIDAGVDETLAEYAELAANSAEPRETASP